MLLHDDGDEDGNDDDDDDDENMARHKDDLTASCTTEYRVPPVILIHSSLSSHCRKRNENITPKYCQYLNDV